MELFPMFISFLVACVVINVCLTKKQMHIARAVFLAFGIVIGTCTLFLIYVDSQLAHISRFYQAMQQVNTYLSQILGISTIVFDVVTLVIAIATIILSVTAIRKIAAYIKSHKRNEQRTPDESQKPIAEPVQAFPRKIFVLHCRWNN